MERGYFITSRCAGRLLALGVPIIILHLMDLLSQRSLCSNVYTCDLNPSIILLNPQPYKANRLIRNLAYGLPWERVSRLEFHMRGHSTV